MADDTKSGTHLAEAKKVLTFFFEHPATLGAIYSEFHPHWVVLHKKKVNTCFAAAFVSISAQIIMELEFLVMMPLFTRTNI